MNIKTVIPLCVMLSAAGTGYLLFGLLKQMVWKEIFPLLIGFFPGVFAGAYFLKALSEESLQFSLGAVLIIYSTYSLFFTPSGRVAKKGWAYFFGFLSGCLNGTIGAGGPPLIIYTSMQNWDKDKIKVTMQGVFIVIMLTTIAIHAFSGIVTVKVLKTFIIAIPAFALGIYIGARLYEMIREIIYKRIIYTTLALLGLMLLCKAVV
jgi:hypothetical protein